MDEQLTQVGVVGLGYWGPNRLRALADVPGARVSWLCDADGERLERASRRHPGVRSTRDYGDLLADPELDAVVLATPVFTHHELTLAALEAGKHAFVEKPLASSSEQASELVAAARERDLTLMCGHTFIYSPPVRRAKQIIDSGELGELHFISSSRVNLGPYRSDVSVLFDLGPHDVSILRYWLEDLPCRVSAVGRGVISPGVADVAFVDLTFDDGLLANVELSWLAPSKLRRTVVVGSKKMLVYEDGTAEPLRIHDSGIEYQDPETFGEYQLSYRTGDIVSLRVPATEPIVAELRDFVASLQAGREPVASSSLALDVIRTVEAAETSMGREGAPVDLRFAETAAETASSR
jgi:predicted dehydrogenase